MEKKNCYPIVETFLSIDGEGIRTGLPVVFVRFFGCNLRCAYCDTKYSYTNKKNVERTEYRQLSSEELTKEIMGYNCNRVTFTGGEPLLQKDYIKWFAESFPHIEINIETNGSLPISEFVNYKNVIITMDWKCESSKMSDEMFNDNLLKLRDNDVLKFVVGTDEDLIQSKNILENYPLKSHIYFSPVFGQMDLEKLAQFVVDLRYYQKVRIGLQIHKIIWDPNQRGV